MQTTLTRIFIDLESVSDGLSENGNGISRKSRKFQGFFSRKLGGLQKKKRKRSSAKLRVLFRPKPEIQRILPPKIMWSPKTKKTKKKKERSSPKLRLIFRPTSQIQTFEGGCFLMRGPIFSFSQKNRPQKHKKHAILHTSQANGGGRLEPPAPPWLRYCVKYFNKKKKETMKMRWIRFNDPRNILRIVKK